MCVRARVCVSLWVSVFEALSLRSPGSQGAISASHFWPQSLWGPPLSPSLSASFLLHHLPALQAPACSPQALLSRAAPWGEAQPAPQIPPHHGILRWGGGNTAWSWLGWREQQPGDPGPGDMEKGKQTERHPERRWKRGTRKEKASR